MWLCFNISESLHTFRLFEIIAKCKLVKWNYAIEVRFCIKNFQWFRPACHFFSKKFLLPTSLPNRQKWTIQSLETLQQWWFWTQVHAEIFYSYIPSSISSCSRFCQFLKSLSRENIPLAKVASFIIKCEAPAKLVVLVLTTI